MSDRGTPTPRTDAVILEIEQDIIGQISHAGPDVVVRHRLIGHARTLERELSACQRECEEQARLNGAGSSREAALLARLAEERRRVVEECARVCEARIERDSYGNANAAWGCAASIRALSAPQQSALDRYGQSITGLDVDSPIARLRFFLSLALKGQDWIDVEQFIDAIPKQQSEQNAEDRALEAMKLDHFGMHGQAEKVLAQQSEQINAEGQAPCYSEVKPEAIEVGRASSDRLNSVPPTPAVNKRTGEDLGQDDHRVPAQPAPSAPYSVEVPVSVLELWLLLSDIRSIKQDIRLNFLTAAKIHAAPGVDVPGWNGRERRKFNDSPTYGIYRCNKHGGYGFTRDCDLCQATLLTAAKVPR